jgi:hypothetical protein
MENIKKLKGVFKKMRKLITLTSLTTGTTKSAITGEVRKVDADKKKQIELIAKNIAELHNAGVNNLLREEEEKWKVNVISNPTPITQTAEVKEGKTQYYRGETVKLFVNGKKITAIGSCEMACEIALHHIRDHTKDIIKSQKGDDVIVKWEIEEAEALFISKIILGNIEEMCCKNCKWFRNGTNVNLCGNPESRGPEDADGKLQVFFHDINECDFWEDRSYFILTTDYGVNIKRGKY